MTQLVTPFERLRSDIEPIIRSINADWRIYITLLETGEELRSTPTSRWTRCPVIKFPILVEAFRPFSQIQLGDYFARLKPAASQSTHGVGAHVSL
jgi:hypothetical protein